MSHEATNEKDHKETSIHTPRVQRAKGVKIGIYLFLGLIALIALTIINNRKKEERKSGTQSSSSAKSSNVIACDFTYNALDIPYGDSLVFQLDPGKSALVNLTNDWCPYWSSSQTDTYDENHVKRVLEKARFIQGPPLSKNSQYLVFQNTKQNSVTLKIGRSEKLDYNAYHF